jgi:putative flippase GtrA
LNLFNSLATDRPAVMAGVRANRDGNAELLPKKRAAVLQAEVAVGFLQARVWAAPSNAFLNVLDAGSSPVFARSLHFLRQPARLRFGRMSRFAAVGAFGTVLNLVIMSVMLGLGSHYLMAAVVATELTILSNFLMQERLVFRDLHGGRPFWQRIFASFGFNNIETLVRLPVLMLLVEALLIPGLLAQAATLAVAFLARFAFTSRVIYRVPPLASAPGLVPATPIAPVGVETA